MGQPEVAIIMGSDSDWPTMRPGAQLLREMGIECEVTVLSAHRTPAKVQAYAKKAAGAGLKIIIAAAGGAAHLAGVIASFTHLPVIGVPMKTSALGGLDSLYSIVQMPAGVPVATVGIGEPGATNAAVLAVRILAIENSELIEKLAEYNRKLEAGSVAKAARVKSALKGLGTSQE